MTTPSVLAERYFKTLIAPGKQLTWFSASAHLPNLEEPRTFAETIFAWVNG